MMMRLFILAVLVSCAAAFSATPALRNSRVAKAQCTMALKPRDLVAPMLVAGAVAFAASEPALAAEFVSKVPEGGNQLAQFVLPAGAKASAQGILGPPGAIFASFIGLYTAATLGAAPWKDGLPGRKMK